MSEFLGRLRGGDAAETLEEVLSGVKSARLQLGTFTHLSDDMSSSLDPLRRAVEEASAFLSRGRNLRLLTAGIIALAGLLNLARGWSHMRSRLPRRPTL